MDDRVVLAEAMAQLSPRQRAAVYLRYSEDLPEQTVADLLSCSVSTVKQHTRRGLAALRVNVHFVTPDQRANLTGMEIS